MSRERVARAIVRTFVVAVACVVTGVFVVLPLWLGVTEGDWALAATAWTPLAVAGVVIWAFENGGAP